MWIKRLAALPVPRKGPGATVSPARDLGSLFLSLLLCAGCLSGLGPADRSFEAGDYSRAASRYEAYLAGEASGPNRERALFRLVLLYSSPETPVHDKERAQDLREVLIEEFPGGPYGSWISWQFFLERRIGTLQDELDARKAHVEQLLGQLREAVAEGRRSRSESEALEEQLGERLAEMRSLESELARAHDEATTQKERMARLTEALELLKSIDLKRAAPKPVAPPPEPPPPDSR